MPYITKQDRARLALKNQPAKTVGELNYLLTCAAIGEINRAGLSYTTINNIVGEFEQVILCNGDLATTEFGREIVGIAREAFVEWCFQDNAITKDQRLAVTAKVMGAFRCAQQEFYRRVAVPYEDSKIAENGDVYQNVG